MPTYLAVIAVMMDDPDFRDRSERNDDSQHHAGCERIVDRGEAEDPRRDGDREANDERHPLFPLGELHERRNRHNADHDAADPRGSRRHEIPGELEGPR